MRFISSRYRGVLYHRIFMLIRGTRTRLKMRRRVQLIVFHPPRRILHPLDDYNSAQVLKRRFLPEKLVVLFDEKL